MTRTKQIETLAYLCCLLFSAKAPAQVSAAASVRVTATLHGRVSINTRAVPVSILLEAGRPANYASVPLEINWNLNPQEVQGFEVIGYFADPNAALAADSGNTVVPAAHVLGRWGTGSFKPFNETHELGTAGGSLSLFSESVFHGHSRGSRTGVLEMTIDPKIASALSSNDYRGVLYVEVRHF